MKYEVEYACFRKVIFDADSEERQIINQLQWTMKKSKGIQYLRVI